MVPAVGRSCLVINRKRVDLPTPFRPTNPVRSAANRALTSANRQRPSGVVQEMLCSSIAGMGIFLQARKQEMRWGKIHHDLPGWVPRFSGKASDIWGRPPGSQDPGAVGALWGKSGDEGCRMIGRCVGHLFVLDRKYSPRWRDCVLQKVDERTLRLIGRLLVRMGGLNGIVGSSWPSGSVEGREKGHAPMY